MSLNKDSLSNPALFFALSVSVALPVALFAQTDQSQSQSVPSADADYHKINEKQSGNWDAIGKSAKPVEPVTAHYVLGPLKEIKILPPSITITGPRYSQRLVVQGVFTDGHQEDITDQARITSSDPKVALVDREAFVRPQSDGKATVTAVVGTHRATAPRRARTVSS